MKREQTIQVYLLATAAGQVRVALSPKGLCGLRLPRRGSCRRRGSSAGLDAMLRRLLRDLRDYFDGKEVKFSYPMDLGGATNFQRAVWRALRRIPHGQTRTYAEIARAVGRPKACRAVGGACGDNPLPLLIPCHRVVGSNGKPGGFSGGRGWKRFLLELEGVGADEGPNVQPE